MRYASFTNGADGGNPAGVVLAADGLDDEAMQAIAAEVGYSESAFLFDDGPTHHRRIRYFSPLAEVAFCGHATIALAVAHAERHGEGRLILETRAGRVVVDMVKSGHGFAAMFRSVPPQVTSFVDADLDEALAALGWSRGDLDETLPPRVASAGNLHPVIAVRARQLLTDLDYDFDALGAVMARCDWTTVQLIWRESDSRFHSRNPFPPGGLYEDPATGAAAPAFGGYLRALSLVSPPARITIEQGLEMGRPSTITIDIPPESGSGILISGTGVEIR
ncbi:PhzF family phenazine biosynthesis protein [Streptomyces canus]|uniref:PhzF family phenazine biosynthesis protein n=1 Tax=Streptomyces canus TaxID=58343 RepID=UPI002B1D441B|nr:PhzF family phenazine biosynthesis protein [Streptomyces canus]